MVTLVVQGAQEGLEGLWAGRPDERIEEIAELLDWLSGWAYWVDLPDGPRA